MTNFARIKGLTSKFFFKNHNNENVLGNNILANNSDNIFISESFPEEEYKKALRDKEKEITNSIVNNPENIKQYNKRGNQALTAIYGIPTALYLGTAVATAIAAPAIVMGLIGFGIAGGAVAATNYITGSQSALGSLYKKLRVKFGKINSKVKINNYKDNFNNEKFKQNEILKNAIANFNNKKISEQQLDSDIQEHIENLINYGKSDFNFSDDKESQELLNKITANVLESNKKLAQINSNKNNVASLQNELNSFVSICQKYDKDLDNNALKYCSDIKEQIANVFKTYENQLNVKKKINVIHDKYAVELKNLEKAYNKTKNPIINSINSLNEQFENLSDADEARKVILDSINKFSEKYSELTMEYEDSCAKIKHNEEQELRESLTIEELNASDNILTAQNICDTLNSFISEQNYAKVNKNLTLNANIFNNEFLIKNSNIKAIIERINNSQPYSDLLEDINGQIQQYANNVNTLIRENLTLNTQKVKKRIDDLESEKNRYDANFKEQNNLYISNINELQKQLHMRRHELTEQAKTNVFEQKQVTKEKFNQFVSEQKEKFNNELND